MKQSRKIALRESVKTLISVLEIRLTEIPFLMGLILDYFREKFVPVRVSAYETTGDAEVVIECDTIKFQLDELDKRTREPLEIS